MDPYKVLGVNPSASDDEIKQVYRELARKYHPDQYNDHPLSELAQEKMKEINEAYDTIMRERQSGGAFRQRGGAYEGSFRQGSTNGGIYERVRQYVTAGNLYQAELLLDQMQERPAEWYFLKGSIYLKKGWYDQAMILFQRASAMEPGNLEYRDALSRMQQNNTMYKNQGQGMYTTVGCCPCDCCTNLICADCCCEMMGGDLIPCC